LACTAAELQDELDFYQLPMNLRQLLLDEGEPWSSEPMGATSSSSSSSIFSVPDIQLFRFAAQMVRQMAAEETVQAVWRLIATGTHATAGMAFFVFTQVGR
jgi:hypothetical protein